MITQDRLGQLRAQARHGERGDCGLSKDQAEELLAVAEEAIVLGILANELMGRHAMEPRHSREDHDCPECAAFDELKRLRKERSAKTL